MSTIFAQICNDGIVFGTHGKIKLHTDGIIISRINDDDIHLSLLGEAGVISVLYDALENEREHGEPKLIMLDPDLLLTTVDLYRGVFNNIVRYFMENYPSMVCEVYRLNGILVHDNLIAACSGATLYRCNNPRRRFVAVGDSVDILTPHLYYSDLMNSNSSTSEYVEFLKLNTTNYDKGNGTNVSQLNLNEIKRHIN